jgi:TolB protein
LKVRGVAALALLLITTMFPGAANAILSIDINASGGRRMPVALPAFVVVSGDAALGKSLPKVIATDLAMTSIFDVIGTEAYLERVLPTHFERGGAPLNFPSWKLVGAEAIVIGKIEVKGDQVMLEMRLYDATLGSLMIGKRYTGPLRRIRMMGHKFANEVLKAFTGVQGVFDTDIAFTAHPGRGAADKGKEVFLIGVDGEDLRKVTDNKSFNLFPRWAPDGQRLAFTSYRSGLPLIYVKNLQDGKEVMAVKYGSSKTPGCFTPAGDVLLFSASASGDSDIYSMNLATGAMVKEVGGGGIDVSPSLSPDGKRMAFVSDRGGSPQVYVKEVGGSVETRVSHAGGYSTSPSWSPAGDVIAFTSLGGGRYSIYTVKSDGSDQKLLASGSGDCLDPCFSPDGRYVVYSFQKKDYSELKIISLDGRFERKLFSGLSGIGSPAWSPRR